jgi:hypothetical protein
MSDFLWRLFHPREYRAIKRRLRAIGEHSRFARIWADVQRRIDEDPS